MNDEIMLAPMWKGETVFCVAGGLSLSFNQRVYTLGYKTIAVNDAYRVVPQADMLYACDQQWWSWHNGCPDFRGYKLQHYSENDSPYPNIDVIKSDGYSGFSDRMDRIRTGGNSGYQALHITIQLGAARIILLGYDMKSTPEKSHWFGEHPNGRQRECRYAEWIKEFPALQEEAVKRGVEIINCSPDSALNCFKKMNIEDVGL